MIQCHCITTTIHVSGCVQIYSFEFHGVQPKAQEIRADNFAQGVTK